MAGLLEATVSTALSAATLAMVTASLAGAVRLDAAALALGDELLQRRQLEQLVDRAAAGAGAGPALPAAVSFVNDRNIVLAADLDGNGAVDAASSETTAVESRRSGSAVRVRVRYGRQAMTVLEVGDADVVVEALDAWGRPAGAEAATLARFTTVPRESGASARSLPFAVLARVLR